jgi:hypothetical protein
MATASQLWGDVMRINDYSSTDAPNDDDDDEHDDEDVEADNVHKKKVLEMVRNNTTTTTTKHNESIDEESDPVATQLLRNRNTATAGRRTKHFSNKLSLPTQPDAEYDPDPDSLEGAYTHKQTPVFSEVSAPRVMQQVLTRLSDRINSLSWMSIIQTLMSIIATCALVYTAFLLGSYQQKITNALENGTKAIDTANEFFAILRPTVIQVSTDVTNKYPAMSSMLYNSLQNANISTTRINAIANNQSVTDFVYETISRIDRVSAAAVHFADHPTFTFGGTEVTGPTDDG